MPVNFVAGAASPAVVGGDDLSTALIIIGAVLLGAFVLPLVMALLEPPTNDPTRSGRVSHRMRRPDVSATPK